jgi:copper(I)-binding protein
VSRRSATAAALLAVGLLSGCGTGLEAQTYHPRTPGDSTHATAGDLELRALAIEPLQEGQSFDVGGQAVVTGVFVNKGDVDDELVDATTEAAASVVLQSENDDDTVRIPAGGRSANDWVLVLDNLSAPLRPGQYVTVTLEFDKAGRTTVSVPVRAGDGSAEGGLESREIEQDPYGGHE